MTSKAENMTEWFKRLSTGGRPSATGSNVSLAAFGKHPGWEDHIPGIGVDTEALASLKQSLYFDGIRGQIDSGAWEKMEQLKRLEGFDHEFLWLRPGHTFLGLMWSSSDRIGRAKYPMILCADGEGISPAFMLENGRPELERLRDTCKALNSAEEVTSECRAALDRLRGTMERASSGWTEPFSDTMQRQRFLDCSELGPDRAGFLRILHECSAEQGMTATKHLRVPVVRSLQIDAIIPWVEFFKCIAPSKAPILFVKRNGEAWLDVIIGEPGSRDFFCLQAASEAVPLTTEVPYEVSAGTLSMLDTVTARLGLSMGDGGQSRPGPAAPPIAVAVVPVASKGAGGRWLVLAAIIVIVILAGIALVIFFTSRGTPAKNSPAAVNKSGIPTVASPVATAGMKYGTAIQAATDAFARGDYDGAIRQSDIALECEPGDQAAMQIKADALKKKKDAASEASGYSGAMTAARNALAAGHYDEALRQVKNALIISPDDQAAMTLDATIAARQDADGRLRQDQYNAAMARGREALSNKNDSEASRQAGIALGLKPGDKDAKELVTQAQQDVVAQQAAPAPATRLSDGAATLKVNVASSSDGLQKNQQYQSEISAVQTAWNKNDFDTVIQNANLALQINPDAADLKSRLRDSVYNKLEIYAVWFGAIRPQDATFPLAKTQLPLAQGDMAPSAAIAYKNQIDYWVKLLNRYQLLDPVHTKLAGAIENNINRY